MASLKAMERFRLDDRVALVTGASSGLGVAFALALAEAGADVVCAARRRDRLDSTVSAIESLGRRGYAIELDVTDSDACARSVDAAVERFGRLDVLVNNAGVGWSMPISREDPADVRRVLDVNLFGSYWMAKAAGRAMQPGSSVVNLSSVIGLTSSHLPQAAYSASKSAIVGLTRDLARQWGTRRGIRVNALAPGYFPSEMTEPVLTHAENDRAWVSNSLLGRRGEPVEAAAAVVFLASSASSYVTGAVLPVDGGWSAG